MCFPFRASHSVSLQISIFGTVLCCAMFGSMYAEELSVGCRRCRKGIHGASPEKIKYKSKKPIQSLERKPDKLHEKPCKLRKPRTTPLTRPPTPPNKEKNNISNRQTSGSEALTPETLINPHNRYSANPQGLPPAAADLLEILEEHCNEPREPAVLSDSIRSLQRSAKKLPVSWQPRLQRFGILEYLMLAFCSELRIPRPRSHGSGDSCTHSLYLILRTEFPIPIPIPLPIMYAYTYTYTNTYTYTYAYTNAVPITIHTLYHNSRHSNSDSHSHSNSNDNQNNSHSSSNNNNNYNNERNQHIQHS